MTDQLRPNKIFSSYLYELESEIEVLMNISDKPPFLTKFHNIIRDKSFKKMEQILDNCSNEYTNEEMAILRNLQLSLLIEKIDNDYLNKYLKKLEINLMTPNHQRQLFSNEFYMSQPKELLAQLPSDLKETGKKQEDFNQLILRWIFAIEISYDIINRCSLYGLITYNTYGEQNQLKNANSPKKPDDFKTFTKEIVTKYLDISASKFMTNTGSIIDSYAKSFIKQICLLLISQYFGPVKYLGGLVNMIKIPLNLGNRIMKVVNFVKNKAIEIYNPESLNQFSNEDNLFSFLIRDSIRSVNETNEEQQKLIRNLVKEKSATVEHEKLSLLLQDSLRYLTDPVQQ